MEFRLNFVVDLILAIHSHWNEMEQKTKKNKTTLEAEGTSCWPKEKSKAKPNT
jgi:hypothetical protein